MAVYRQVHISFWQDPFVLSLTPEEKFFFLYLMTNSKTKQCGCYEIAKTVMVFETGYNIETIEKLLHRFIKYKKIQYNEDTKELLVVNWLKYNSCKSPKIQVCIENELLEIKYKSFANFILDRLGIDYPRSIDTEAQKEEEKEKEKTKEEEKEKTDTAKKFAEDSVEIKLSKYLFSLILERNPKAKKPNFNEWAKHIVKMIQADKREPDEIRTAIEWCQDDEFWFSNILSTKKLRKHYDTMYAAAQRKKFNNVPKRITNNTRAAEDFINE